MDSRDDHQPPNDPERWTVEEVVRWVDHCLSQKYERDLVQAVLDALSRHHIDGEALCGMDHTDWKEIAPIMGVRKHLLKRVRDLLTPPPPPPPPPPVPAPVPTTGPIFRPEANSAPAPAASLLATTRPAVVPCGCPPAVVPDTHDASTEEATSQEATSPTNSDVVAGAEGRPGKPPVDVHTPERKPVQIRFDLSSVEYGSALDGGPESGVYMLGGASPASPGLNPRRVWHLLNQSQFSNCPLVDRDFHPSNSLPSWERLLQTVLYWCVLLCWKITTLWRLFRVRDLVAALMPVALTHVCIQNGWYAQLHPSLLLNTCVFPLAFAVNAAYQRREAALQIFSHLKACMLTIYFIHRDWTTPPRGTTNLPDHFMLRTREIMRHTFLTLQSYFGTISESQRAVALKALYRDFGNLSCQTDLFRDSGIPPPLVSRPVQDLREALSAVEKLRVFHDYRTPSTIRAFLELNILLAPILMAPYFAHFSLFYKFMPAGYMMAFAVPFLFNCLLKLQQWLENPFGSFQDSIKLEFTHLIEVIEDIQDRSSPPPGRTPHRVASRLAARFL